MSIQKLSSAENITHESETQRQYIRVGLAASVKINAKKYRVIDLSSGGFSVEASENDFSGDIQRAVFLFNFEGFTFHLKVNARLVYHTGEKAGFAFTELKARQISLLNYLLKSHLSGLIVSEGDIINVVTRHDFSKTRERPQSNDNKTWLSRVLPFSLLLMLGLIGLFFLFGNIYENTMVIKSPIGIVESSDYSVRAERNGTFHSLLAEGVRKVNKDQPIGAIKDSSDPTSSGEYIIKSACNCVITGPMPRDGEFYTLGETIFQLTPVDAKPWIVADVNPEDVHQMRLQDDAEIKLVGETKFIEGNITEFLPPGFNQSHVQVKVKPKEPLPLDTVGRQAYVEFSIY